MQNSIKIEQQEQSHGQQDAKETSNSSELMETEKIEGTPFTIIRWDEQYFLSMGQYRLTEPLPNKQAVLDHIDNNIWDIVLQMIIIHEKTKTELNKFAIQKIADKQTNLDLKDNK